MRQGPELVRMDPKTGVVSIRSPRGTRRLTVIPFEGTYLMGQKVILLERSERSDEGPPDLLSQSLEETPGLAIADAQKFLDYIQVGHELHIDCDGETDDFQRGGRPLPLFPLETVSICRRGSGITAVRDVSYPTDRTFNEILDFFPGSVARIQAVTSGRIETVHSMNALRKDTFLISKQILWRRHDLWTHTPGLVLLAGKFAATICPAVRAMDDSDSLIARKAADDFITAFDKLTGQMTDLITEDHPFIRRLLRDTQLEWSYWMEKTLDTFFQDVSDHCGMSFTKEEIDEVKQDVTRRYEFLPTACEAFLDAHPGIMPFQPINPSIDLAKVEEPFLIPVGF